jgi:Bifunctional DNA primase/polymerase, N-terminal
MGTSQTYSMNESADFWRYDIGVNVLPADTKNKKPLVPWYEWQDKPIPEQLHNQWKEQGAFSQGIAIIPGKVWHNENKKDLYFVFIDADIQKAIDDLCTIGSKITSLQELSKKFLVEQHKDNPKKAHIYFYSPIPFPKKNADSVLGLEVKGLGEHGIAFCFPTTHKDGMPYEIIGTNQPVALTVEQARELIQHINQICMKYGLQYLERETSSQNITSKMQNIIKSLDIDTTVRIPQGQRHVTLISAADSLLFRHLGKGKKKSEKSLRDFYESINYQLCEPEPLPRSEIDSIWNSALEFVNRIRDKEEQNKNDNDSESDSPSKSYAETLLQLATENIQLLFKNQYGTAYAQVNILNHDEILRVESDKFKRYLSKLFYDNESNKIANVEAINNVIQILQAKAEYEGQTIPLSLRVAWHGNGNSGVSDVKDIYYDMTDAKGHFVKISKEEKQGWQLVNQTPIPLFVKYNQTAQAEPYRSYEPDIFDKFLQLTNVKDEQRYFSRYTLFLSLFLIYLM